MEVEVVEDRFQYLLQTMFRNIKQELGIRVSEVEFFMKFLFALLPTEMGME
ncbi:hypothetical protein SDC9_119293 [bioreactor metagenome]|uniref:Uncharacterized protein n=1 Tax=bioreactor metagenome TaxID=1076179 RepID=A0A645C3H3_9ZZZZ